MAFYAKETTKQGLERDERTRELIRRALEAMAVEARAKWKVDSESMLKKARVRGPPQRRRLDHQEARLHC